MRKILILLFLVTLFLFFSFYAERTSPLLVVEKIGHNIKNIGAYLQDFVRGDEDSAKPPMDRSRTKSEEEPKPIAI